MGDLIPLASIIVGGVLLFPVVVGITVRAIRVGRTPPATRDADIARLETELQHTREELQRLAERQQFLEALLEKRSPPTSLPRP